MNKFKQSLARYMDAALPIIFINSFEEDKIIDIVRGIFVKRDLLEWNVRGISDIANNYNLLQLSLPDALDFFLNDTSNLQNKILIIKGFHFFYDDPDVSERLKILAQLINSGTISNFSIIIISPIINVPVSLEHFVTILSPEFMTPDEIKSIIYNFIRDYNLNKPNDSFIDELTTLFKGLNETDIKSVLALAVSSDAELNHSSLSLIFDQKQQLIKKSAVLDLIPNNESIDSIGGLDSLKSWLHRKAFIFKNFNKAKLFGVDTPKGLLICGMPGCGKSLSVKATATLFGFPLIRLDMGKVMGKYVGESAEANMRHAISLAEASSPCVLWIDELEKAFAGINADERRKIFQIHISKRRPKDLSVIDINLLVDKTKGYSGADIEEIVKDSVETAFATLKSSLSTEDIIRAIDNTHSLSEVMKESIDKLSKLYKDLKFKSAST